MQTAPSDGQIPGVDGAAYGYTKDPWHGRHPSRLAAWAARPADTIILPAPGVEPPAAKKMAAPADGAHFLARQTRTGFDEFRS